MKKQQIGTLIQPSGAVTVVRPKGTDFTLAELQGFVGGYIEHLSVGRGHLYLDEEGKCKGLPLNRMATERALQAGVQLMPGDVLLGNVIFVEREKA